MTTTNQRREARAVVAIPIVLVRGRAEQRLETVDVSYRGVFVRASAAHVASLRSLVRLKMELPTGGFGAHAMVVHVGTCGCAEGMGLQFWGLSGNERRAWETFVSRVHGAQRPQPSTGREPQTTPPSGTDASQSNSGIRTIGAPDAVPAAFSGRSRS